MSPNDGELYSVELDIDQVDLIKCLLLDQLIGITALTVPKKKSIECMMCMLNFCK
jgi:hypothetical protein